MAYFTEDTAVIAADALVVEIVVMVIDTFNLSLVLPETPG